MRFLIFDVVAIGFFLVISAHRFKNVAPYTWNVQKSIISLTR